MLGFASFTDLAVDCNNRLNFRIGDTRQCLNITIQNDDICEWNNGINEDFSAQLVHISGSDIGVDYSHACIFIDETSEPECSKSSQYSFVGRSTIIYMY